jgi:hypothetical protein
VSQLPQEIGELEALEHLSVPHNRYLQSLPAGLARLPKLLTLNVAGTSIQIPDDLLALEKAQKIWIAR